MSFELPVLYYPEDAELSQLRKREMKKFYEAKMKMKGAGLAASAAAAAVSVAG